VPVFSLLISSGKTLPFLRQRNNLYLIFSSKNMLRRCLFAQNVYEGKKYKPFNYADSRCFLELLALGTLV
jgi:hypothetical protein